jgi:hypothetical protein
MLIRIHCPNPKCKKQLRIDARHAGKKIACQGCKQHIRLPTAEELKLPVKSVDTPEQPGEEQIVDFDMLAHEAVAIEKEQHQVDLKEITVDFTCPQCDEPVKMAIEHAGKRAPCPSCRRIITVPKAETGKPKDWREKEIQGPSLAKKEEVKLEGAWGNQSIARVSQEALEEAKAIPKVKRKLTVRDYVTYGTYAAVAIAVLVVSYWGWNRWRSSAIEGNTLAAITTALQENKLPAEVSAVMRTSLGDWLLTSNAEMDKKREGLAELRKALATSNDPIWNWALALDVVNIIGPHISLDPKVEKPLVDLPWLVQLVSSVKVAEPREEVIRALCRAVLGQAAGDPEKTVLAQNLLTTIIKQAIPAVNLSVTPEGAKAPTNVTDYSDQLSALGVLAQELLRAKAQENAITVIGKTPTSGARMLFKKEMPVPKSFVAVMSALNQPPLEVTKTAEGELELGQMTGYYLANQLARGNELLQKRKLLGSSEANLLSFLELAAQAIDNGKPSEALPHLTDAMQIAQIYTTRRESDWKNRVYAHVRLCVLTAKAGEVTMAEERINQLKLDEVPSMGQLARGLVARERSMQDATAAVNGLQPNSAALAVAVATQAKKQAEASKVKVPDIVDKIAEGPVKALATLAGLTGYQRTVGPKK